MDQIVESQDDRKPAPRGEGFAVLWSDMPQDVMESVHLHDRATCLARLTMDAPRARVEICIAPRHKSEPAVAANQSGAQAFGQPETQEKDTHP